jgi:hypothetical protein
LLGSDPTAQLNLREDPDRGVYVVGLTHTVVKNSNQILDLMNRGSVFLSFACAETHILVQVDVSD